MYEFGEAQVEKETETDNDTKVPEKGETTEGVKKEDTTTPKKDPTTAPGTIMYAGGTTLLILITMIVTVIGTIAYIKNKELKGI